MIDLELIEGDLLIDVDYNYTELFKIHVRIRDERTYLQLNSEKLGYPTIELEKYEGKLCPIELRGNRRESKILIDEENLFFQALDFLYINPWCSEKQLKDYLEEKKQVSSNLSSVYLKIWVIKGFLRTKIPSKNKCVFRLNPVFESHKKEVEYYSLIASDLRSKSRRIELLINHGGTKGTYRENLLIGVLKKYIPKKYNVSSGFIYGKKNQIDILIYDQHNHIPFFNEDGIVVVSPQSVRAIIEVKSKLTEGKLKEAMKHIYDVCPNISQFPIFKGIFAFSPGFTKVDSMLNHVLSFYNESKNEFPGGIDENEPYDDQLIRSFLKSKIVNPFGLIESICVLDQFYIQVEYDTEPDKSSQCKYYQPRVIYNDRKENDEEKFNFSSILFLKNLFSYLDIDKEHKEVNSTFGGKINPSKYLKNEKRVFDAAQKYDFVPSDKDYSKEYNFLVNNFNLWRSGNNLRANFVLYLKSLRRQQLDKE